MYKLEGSNEFSYKSEEAARDALAGKIAYLQKEKGWEFSGVYYGSKSTGYGHTDAYTTYQKYSGKIIIPKNPKQRRLMLGTVQSEPGTPSRGDNYGDFHQRRTITLSRTDFKLATGNLKAYDHYVVFQNKTLWKIKPHEEFLSYRKKVK